MEDILWFQKQVQHVAAMAVVGREAATEPIRIFYKGQLRGDYTPRQTFLEVSPNFFDIVGLQLKEGRLLTPDDADQPGRVAVIAANAVPPGEWQKQHGRDRYTLGETVTLGAPLTRERFSVVGVLEPYAEKASAPGYHRPGDYNNIIYVPIGKAPAVYSHPIGGSFGYRKPPVDDYWLLMQPKPGELAAARHEAVVLLTARTGHPPIIEDADYRELIMEHSRTVGLQYVATLQALASLVIGAAVFVLAMARSVAETRWWALQRALGATQSQAAWLFARGVLVYVLAGGILGAALGLWLAPLLSRWLSLPVHLSVTQVLGVAQAIFIVSLVAVAIPIRQLVQVSPARALRGELRQGWGINSWIPRRRLMMVLLVVSMFAALYSLDSATVARNTLAAYLDAAGTHTLLVTDALQRPAVLERVQAALTGEGYETQRLDAAKAMINKQLLDVVGVDRGYFPLRNIALAAGHLPARTLHQPLEAVVGANLAQRRPVGSNLTINGHTLRVVGALEPAARGIVDYFYDRDSTFFITLDGIAQLGSLPTPPQRYLLAEAPNTTPQKLRTELTADGVDLTGVTIGPLSGSIPELLEWTDRYNRYLTVFLFLLIGVLVAAWAAALGFELPERRYELVLARALGATRVRLFWWTFWEGTRTLLIVVLGSLGILVAYRLATGSELIPLLCRLPSAWIVLLAFLVPMLMVQGFAAFSAVRVGDSITQFREL